MTNADIIGMLKAVSETPKPAVYGDESIDIARSAWLTIQSMDLALRSIRKLSMGSTDPRLRMITAYCESALGEESE